MTFIVAGIWISLIALIGVKVQQAMREKAPMSLASKIQMKPLTREEKAEAAKDKLAKDREIIEEADLNDPVAKKMAERFADKKFAQKLKGIIDD